MRFNVLVALLGVTSAINIRQSGTGAGTTATAATAAGTVATAAGTDAVTGVNGGPNPGPGAQQCNTSGPTGPPPATMQCPPPLALMWASPVVAAPC